MTASQIINQTLWSEMRQAINNAYASAGDNQDLQCLRDYAEDISWSDDLQKLLDHETANEREHRRNRPSIPGFGCSTAARLIIMRNVSDGSKMEALPKATAFLVLRKTAVEAEVIGFLIREYLAPEWHKAVNSYDYAKLMAAAA